MLSLLSLCQYSLYADDILLIALSFSALQSSMTVCEEELILLDMQLNIQKSMCIRFGARFRVPCKSLATSFGGVVHICGQHNVFQYCCTVRRPVIGARETFPRIYSDSLIDEVISN